MLTVAHTFTAKEPIFHGSDSNLGIFRAFRREKILLQNPYRIQTKFLAGEERLRQQAICCLLLAIWDKMDDKGRYTIYDEFASKVLASCSVQTKFQFINTLASKLEIRSLHISEKDNTAERHDIDFIISLLSDDELTHTIKDDLQYIILLFRKFVLQRKEAKNEDFLDDIICKLKQVAQREFKLSETIKNSEDVPIISGNSIRGILRRVCMRDYINQLQITKLSPEWYHRLFTGGALTESNGSEELDKRRQFIDICPMLGLFGTAFGSGMMQGSLVVGTARLKCKENNTGEIPYRQFTEVIFGTRLDSSKTETEIDLGDKPQKAQMLYEFETISSGAQFEHLFGCQSSQDIVLQAFYKLLSLFCKVPHIGAKAGLDFGRVDLAELEKYRNKELETQYDAYIAANKEKMLKFFEAK